MLTAPADPGPLEPAEPAEPCVGVLLPVDELAVEVLAPVFAAVVPLLACCDVKLATFKVIGELGALRSRGACVEGLLG